MILRAACLSLAAILWVLPVAAQFQPLPTEPPADQSVEPVAPVPGIEPATTPSASVPARDRILLLRGATVHTLTSQGSLLAGDVLVQGKHIIAIGPDLSAHRKTASAQVINLFGKVITPGFVLPWSRLGLLGSQGKPRDRSTTLSAGFAVARAWDSAAPDLGEAVAAGFTSAHIVPLNPGKLFSGQSAVISLHPQNARLLTAERFSVVVARLSGLDDLPSVAINRLDSAFEDARRFRTNRFAIDSGGYFGFDFSRDDLESLVRVVDDENWLAVEAHGQEEIARLLDLTRRLRLRLMLYGGAESAPLAARLREQGAVAVLNPVAATHKGLEPQQALQAARVLNQGGVPLMFGSDRPDAPWRVRQAAGTAVAWGLAWEEALKAMTLYPAQVLGLPDRGQIAPGKVADLVVWSGDPLEISSRAERVFFAGEEFRPISRDELLARKYARQLNIPISTQPVR